MRSRRAPRHVIDILFVLALFGAFIVTALIVAFMGAEVYSGTVENMNRNFDTQTSLTYVSTKIRQNDVSDAVRIDSLGGVQALVLEQSVEGEVYQTWIYCYDGFLKEMFIKQGTEIAPEFGASIMEVDSFALTELSEDLLQVSTTDRNGNPISMMIGLRTE
ncbi:DUF4860 domain-containing protein [Ruminococcaceae bacterium OttesenSCG-928-L11]|nr:DUF4860 domain-containing protein [Ruminococcaceae bacterium OttesenSCG-928-L11]